MAAANPESPVARSNATLADPNFPLIRLPREFRARRATTRVDIKPGESHRILEADGPGCVRHFWITTDAGAGLELEITCDDADEPHVRMSVDRFFGVLLGQKPYRIESAPVKLLPKNGYNSYFPVPFQSSCRIALSNTGEQPCAVWSMVDWHGYEEGTEVTPYRLHALHRSESPAAALGSYLLGDLSGRGFVAGLFMGIRRKDTADLIFHTGGDTWLLDGETSPHVLRGIGVEDVFGQSFGFHRDNSQWSGCPYVIGEGPKTAEGVAYRFWGVDTVPFRSSLILQFGSRANDTESVLYYYRARGSRRAEVDSPKKWTLFGPFDCKSFADFERSEFPEKPVEEWPGTWEWGGRTFAPVVAASEHSWIDFARHFRRDRGGNTGTQPESAAAYARTTVTSQSERRVSLRLGFDDWLKVWLNGEAVAALRHDKGFETADVPVTLRKGENELLVKLSNFDNIEWRCWALSCVITDAEPGAAADAARR